MSVFVPYLVESLFLNKHLLLLCLLALQVVYALAHNNTFCKFQINGLLLKDDGCIQTAVFLADRFYILSYFKYSRKGDVC